MNKSFVFDFKNNNLISGMDECLVNEVTIVRLMFNNKKAYFYVSNHDGLYSGFDSFWKVQHQEDPSKIWDKIFDLDRNGYICFNDIYDNIDNLYQNIIEDDNSEENFNSILDYAKIVLNQEDYLIVEFCYKYLELLNNYNESVKYKSPKFVFKCVVDFYIKYNEFYNKYIEIKK